MPEYAYRIVDVFTDKHFEGNALAVLPAADGIDDATMQKVAREFNLSETVFIVKTDRAGCRARFRIFTPTMEMRFAGHPTIGGAYIARRCGLIGEDLDRFSIDEPIGEVAVRVERGEATRMWLTTPPIEFGAYFEPATCADVLGLDVGDLHGAAPQLVSAGNPNIYVALRDPESVDRAWLDLAGVRRLHRGNTSSDCVFVFAPTATGAYARMFAPEHGVVEDPATGSATGPLAAYMMRHGLVDGADGTRFVSEQGTKMGRRSLLHVAIHGANGCDGIEVGGNVVLVASGTLTIP